MILKTVEPEEVKFFEHGVEYAQASGPVENPDHLANLRTLRDWLTRKRRNLVLDSMQYPQACLGRALDIQKLQPAIDALDRAIEDEERIASNGGALRTRG